MKTTSMHYFNPIMLLLKIFMYETFISTPLGGNQYSFYNKLLLFTHFQDEAIHNERGFKQ